MGSQKVTHDWATEQQQHFNEWAAAVAAKSLESCPTLCDPIDGSPPGSPIPGILQARTLERVAVSFSNASKWKRKVKSLSHVRLLATQWTEAYQAPLSMGFSRQEYWSRVPSPSPKEEWDLAICDNMDGPWGHYAKWNESDTERQILYDLSHKWTTKQKQAHR